MRAFLVHSHSQLEGSAVFVIHTGADSSLGSLLTYVFMFI